MSTPSSAWLEVTESEAEILVCFAVRKILNDDKMETIAQELLRLADQLAGRDLRLDFASVEYVQSSVLGKLITLHKKVAAGGRRLILCHIHPSVDKVFTVTRLEKIFTFDPARNPGNPEAQ
jgi:anti-sigma B factor antagonist